MHRLLRGILLLALAVGCGDGSLDPLPLEIEVQANRVVAAPGDSINFLVTAQGGSLAGIEAAFGDGAVEVYPTGGARTARVTFKHAYAGRGTYTMEATVNDASAGTRSATIVVQVN